MNVDSCNFSNADMSANQLGTAHGAQGKSGPESSEPENLDQVQKFKMVKEGESKSPEVCLEECEERKCQEEECKTGRNVVKKKRRPKTEDYQMELIRKLEEKNRRKIEEEEKAQAKLKAKRDRYKGVPSRLLLPKRRNRTESDPPISLESKKADPLIDIVKKVQTQGPDPRHAAFLAKLAEKKKNALEESLQKHKLLQKRKENLKDKVLSIGHKVLEEKQKFIEENGCSEKKEEVKVVAKAPVIPTVWKKHIQSQESDTGTLREMERTMDREKWAHRQGIEPDRKVFVCSNGYPAVRQALKDRGWYENEDRESSIWDLYFTMKMTPLVNKELDEDQITNRFFGTGEMCSKSGISKNLRSVQWFESEDPGTFFPRCYNLGTCDGDECEDFFEDFKITAAERILKILRNASHCKDCKCFMTECECEENCVVQGSPYLIRTAMRMCKKYVNRYNDDYVDSTQQFQPPPVSCLDWSIINSADDNLTIDQNFLSRFRMYSKSNNIQCLLDLFQHVQVEIDEDEEKTAEAIEARQCKKYVQFQIKKMTDADHDGMINSQVLDCKLILQALSQLDQLLEYRGQLQSALNGNVGENVWIVKPAGKSRGRGIQCFNHLEKLIKYTRVNSQETTKWVVQKYMENSLIVHKRKFDIRQWVLVTNWNPLTIYLYDDCYLRFCVGEYSLEDLEDRFIHLANNSISKHSENFHGGPIDENMWGRDDFIKYMDEQGVKGGGENKWFNSIKPAIQKIVRMSLSCVQDLVTPRTNSFEIYGFDLMLDESLNPWLIEINSSPSMEYSTKITKDLAQAALRDAITCVLDGKYKTNPSGKRKVLAKPATNIDTGKWEILYVSPHEYRRKLDSTSGLAIKGDGIEAYNKGATKQFFVRKRRKRKPKTETTTRRDEDEEEEE